MIIIRQQNNVQKNTADNNGLNETNNTNLVLAAENNDKLRWLYAKPSRTYTLDSVFLQSRLVYVSCYCFRTVVSLGAESKEMK